MVNELLNFLLVRFVVKLILKPSGLTVCEDHFARWRCVNGKITRTLYPIGWRISKFEHSVPQSQLEQFINENKKA